MSDEGSKFPTSTSSDRGKHQPVQVRWKQFSWSFEIVCASVSFGALVAIVVILRINNKRPLQNWDLRINESTHISLNVVIATLGTICKSTIAVVLSSGVSQAKWSWFRQRKPLGDYEIFDAASRGPLGSVQLLWRTRLRLASLGAILTILSLTFDPFLQLLITYPGQTQQTSDPSITLSRAHEYTKGDMIESGWNFLAPDNQTYPSYTTIDDSNMVAAMSNALWNDKRLEPTYNCLSGNCTWPSHVSIAICNTCFNTTDRLIKSFPANITFDYSATIASTNSTKYSLGSLSLLNPDGIMIAGAVGMTSTATLNPNETLNFKNSQTLLYSFTFITADKAYLNQEIAWENTTVLAMECGLSLCSNTYSSTVQNGKFSETIQSTRSERVPTSWSLAQPRNTSYILNGTWNPIGVGYEYDVPRTDLEIELSSIEAGVTSFRIPKNSVYSLLDVINSTFSAKDTQRDVWIDGPVMQYASSTMQALWSASSIESVFSNLAIDMSAKMRSESGALKPLIGNSHESITIIRIRWPFIIVPAFICIVGVVFLFAMIMHTKRTSTPLWKGSALAGLVWGLNEEARQTARDSWRVNEDGRQVKVIYKGGRDQGELMQ